MLIAKKKNLKNKMYDFSLVVGWVGGSTYCDWLHIVVMMKCRKVRIAWGMLSFTLSSTLI